MTASWQERAMGSPGPKIASLPVLALAMAVVQLGAAFLAISVQQSTGARLDGFLDGLVVLTVLWTIVVLVDLFAFPDRSMTRAIAGPAFAVTVVVAVLLVIFRAVEGIMGHSLGLRYAFGRIGYSSALVWGTASLWFLLVSWIRARQAAQPPSPTNEPEPDTDPELAPMTPPDASAPPSPSPSEPPKKKSAFSAALESEDG